ncbi:hypothetical protein B7494_g3410 [Chlorociboria aeruginascens]|nr:hypothetical protein B7494_g3410 [Chlorociboria aeruginascens]
MEDLNPIAWLSPAIPETKKGYLESGKYTWIAMQMNTTRDIPRLPKELHLNKLGIYDPTAFASRGAYGVVSRRWDVRTGIQYAYKEPINKKAFDKILWNREIEIMRQLSHDHIVQLIESTIDPWPRLVLEYVPGGSLQGLSLTVEESMTVLCQGLLASEYLHERKDPIAHRDIKPGNILLQCRDPIHLKLTDFSFSRAHGDFITTCGTPRYFALEVLQRKKYSPVVDIWSLGVVVFECVYNISPNSDNYPGRRSYLQGDDPTSPYQQNPFWQVNDSSGSFHPSSVRNVGSDSPSPPSRESTIVVDPRNLLPNIDLFGQNWITNPNCVGSGVAAMGEESLWELSGWESLHTIPRPTPQPVDAQPDHLMRTGYVFGTGHVHSISQGEIDPVQNGSVIDTRHQQHIETNWTSEEEIAARLLQQIRNEGASTASQIRETAFSMKTCLDLFNFYVDWNEKNQHRSMRQVLEVLASLITLHPDPPVSRSIKGSILWRLLSIISHQAAQPLVKPAFKSLELFLGKKTVSPDELIKVYKEQKVTTKSRIPRNSDISALDSTWDVFISEIFGWMNLADVSPAAGKFLVTIFLILKKISPKTEEVVPDHRALWQKWIREGLSKNPDSLENVKNYLLPPLFKLDRPSSLGFLEEINKQTPISDLGSQELNTHSILQLAAMEVGKKAGLVSDPSTFLFPKTGKKSTNHVILEEGAIASLLTHTSDTVRSLAFSVLVSSSSSIRPLSSCALYSLQNSMGILHADTDAKFRNDILSNTKHLIERLRGATAYLVRELDNISMLCNLETGNFPNTEKQEMFEEAGRVLKSHEEFLVWYFKFLFGELISTASYQRHITALKAISLFIRSGVLNRRSTLTVQEDYATVWPYSINLFTPQLIRLLMDLVMDPFEDVRSSATSILKMASKEDFDSSLEMKLLNRESIGTLTTNEINRIPTTQAMKSTDSSPIADSTTSLGILTGFKARAEVSSKKTGRADYADGVARSYELIYCFSDTSESHLNLVENLIKDVEAKLEIAETDLAKAVMSPVHSHFAALNFVWDTVDYSSDFHGHILGESDLREVWNDYQQRIVVCCSHIWKIVKEILCNDSPEGHLPEDLEDVDIVDTKDVLSYSFRAIHESSPQVNLLEEWYQGAIDCIFEQASTTRRSAGIPALITGILSANYQRPDFQAVMTELKSLASRPVKLSETDETNLPQVHAMNSLKEIFKSSTLGKRSESHITDCLQLAADSLNSEILIDCLFGTCESKVVTETGWDGRSTRLSYDRYPALPELLLKLLKQPLTESHSTITVIGAVESVFPALDLIRRAGPPPTLHQEIEKYVSIHLGSKIWQVRELAARTICALMLRDDWLEALTKLIKTSRRSSNKTHGILMAVRFVLERRLALVEVPAIDPVDLCFLWGRIIDNIRDDHCSEIKAAISDIVIAIYQIVLSRLTFSEKAFQGRPADILIYKDPFAQFCRTIEHPKPDVSIHGHRLNLASLQNSAVRQAVYNMAVQEDIEGLKKILDLIAEHDTDMTLVALHCIPQAWSRNSSTKSLLGLVNCYLSAIKKSQSPEVQSAAISNLSEVLDKLFTLSIEEFSKIQLVDFRQELKSCLQIRNKSPRLYQRMETWGKMISAAGNANNDFETRHAAIASLNSFYNTTCFRRIDQNPRFLPSLLALYDTLNDDDDEIRSLGAVVVSSILKKSLIPLAAQEEFVKWLVQHYGSSPLFAWNTMCRIIGDSDFLNYNTNVKLEPAESQFAKAMRDDDALFVEEEQNLFLDEVRESRLWSGVFEQALCLPLESHAEDYIWRNSVAELTAWAMNGILTINRLLEREDGPFGWTSKPSVFAACMRVLLCAKIVLKTSIREETSTFALQKALDVFIALGKAQNIHPFLLSEIQDQEVLVLKRKEGRIQKRA